jgi:cell division protein FtsB
MQQYKRDLTKVERRLVKRIILLVAVVSVLWLLFAPNWGLVHYRKLQSQVDSLAQENRNLEERNAELQKEIDRLQNDDAYLEELARQKYGLLKENETVYEVK